MTQQTYAQIHATPPAPIFQNAIAPPMSALCLCGRRYGMHRVHDYACPNDEWKPGNGQDQWLPWHFVRATSNNPGASRATSAPAALNQAANEEDSPA